MASSRKSLKNSTLLARVSAVLDRHVRRGDRLVVGLSGGVDSVVLLDLLRRAARRHKFDLAALHVNHQIHPSARDWAKFCRALCRRHAIPLSVRTVVVPRGNSLEAAARAARYLEYSTARGHAVALAHNLDDQAETLLMQLLRGAGVKGASAMPEYRIEDRRSRIEDRGMRIEGSVGLKGRGGPARGKLNPRLLASLSSIPNPAILRPLLEVPRSEILAYARARKLAWIEDDSNQDTMFDRNFIRHQVLPVIAGRYPSYRQTMLRASRNFAEAAQLADACAVADAGDCERVLDLGRLQELPLLRVKNVIRFFLARRGLLMPSARRLEECARQILHAGAGARISIRLGGNEMRRYGDELHLLRLEVKPPPAFERPWRGEKIWRIPELGGALIMTRCRGRGISTSKLARGAVTLRLRCGGERLRLDAARPRRTLKNLFQELHIPDWQRDRLPLLFVTGALAYAAGIGVDAAFQAAPVEMGIVPEWRPDTP
jgi:tRNA(Ile)-lysidine synthase